MLVQPARRSSTAQATVQFVFVRRGQPLGRHFLFTDPLATACKQVGLIDSRGRATVTAHRFRHTVGTQLAEGGARIWVLQSQLTNYFLPQQKLVSKIRDGAKVTKTYDRPTTPQRRAEQHPAVTAEEKTIMTDTLAGLNPAAVQRAIQALTAQLLTLTTGKARATTRPQLPAPSSRAFGREPTTPATRAS